MYLPPSLFPPFLLPLPIIPSPSLFFYFLSSFSFSPSKVVTDVMVNPPQPGDPSYELFDQVNDFVGKHYTAYSMNLPRR